MPDSGPRRPGRGASARGQSPHRSCRVRPDSASWRARIPASASWSSRGSTTRRAIVSWRLAPRRHDPTGSSVMKSLMTTSIERRRTPAHPRQPGAQLGLGRGRRSRHQRPHQLREVANAAGRRQLELDPVADQDQADPIAVLDRRRGQKRRSLGRPIGLGRAFSTEPHACRDVDHQPERQRAFLDVSPHERSTLPRGHVPVEMSHVVARLVGTQLRKRQPDPRPCAVVRAGELRDRSGPDPKSQPPRPPHDGRCIDRFRTRHWLTPLERPEHQEPPMRFRDPLALCGQSPARRSILRRENARRLRRVRRSRLPRRIYCARVY